MKTVNTIGRTRAAIRHTALTAISAVIGRISPQTRTSICVGASGGCGVGGGCGLRVDGPLGDDHAHLHLVTEDQLPGSLAGPLAELSSAVAAAVTVAK